MEGVIFAPPVASPNVRKEACLIKLMERVAFARGPRECLNVELYVDGDVILPSSPFVPGTTAYCGVPNLV